MGGVVAASASETRVEPASVEAYLRYRSELATSPTSGPQGSWKALRRDALAEEQALNRAGLSDSALERVEPLVLTMLARLRAEQLSQVDEALATYERMNRQMAPAQQAELAPVLAEMRARKARMGTFAAERELYGSAAVDAVLKHQKELLATPGKSNP